MNPSDSDWETFKADARNPIIWRHLAYNLLYTAKCTLGYINDYVLRRTEPRIWHKYINFFPYYVLRMLMGYALEGLLKCYLLLDVQIFDETFKKEGVFSGALKTHNLVKLYKRAGIPMSKNEEAYLLLLTKCIKWGGRYPIPAKEDELHQYEGDVSFASEPPKNIGLLFNRGVGEKEMEFYDSLFDNILALIDEKHQRITRDT